MDINLNDINFESYQHIADEAVLQCYIHNRKNAPSITIDQWATVFGANAYLYEIEMQRRMK